VSLNLSLTLWFVVLGACVIDVIALDVNGIKKWMHALLGFRCCHCFLLLCSDSLLAPLCSLA